jgi:hypothetical protein
MFAVYGVCREDAKRAAMKDVDRVMRVDGAMKTLTLVEFTEQLDKKTNEHFKTMRPKKIGQLYSNQSIAAYYMELLEKGGARNLEIKKRTCPTGKDGAPIIPPGAKRAPYSWVCA